MSTPSCSPGPTPDPTSEARVDLNTFDWTSLDTTPSRIHRPQRKTDRAIQIQSTATLRSIADRFGNPSGLSALVEGTRALMTRKWKHFHLYLACDADFPACEKLWNRTEWRKWDLVEFFTKICDQYANEVEKAGDQGMELLTKGVDEEFSSLLNCLLGLEVDGEGVVSNKEWERAGTQTTLRTRGLFVEDVTEDETAKRKGIKKASGAEEEDKDEDEMFEGQEMKDALPEIRITDVDQVQRQWSGELADRPRRGRTFALPTGVWG